MKQGPPATVSVVIPTYNAEAFALRAIRSALEGQDGPAARVLEVIVVDDASQDGTLARIRAEAGALPALRILENPRNLGPAGTRNRAIAEARGDWIAVLDADDAFAPGRLDRLISVARAEGFDAIADLPLFYDLAAGRAVPEQLPASGAVATLTLPDLLEPDPVTGLDLGLLKPVFSRALVDRNRWRYPEELRHGEDFDLYFRLLSEHVPFGLLREAFYMFSTRIGAVSGRYSPGSVTDVNYRAIAAHMQTLSQRHGATAAADRAILTALTVRRDKALRQNRIHGWTALRKGDVGRLWRWLRSDHRNAGALLATFGAKIRGQRGRPE